MSKLKATFEAQGLRDVSSYINSGNIIFADSRSAKKLVPLLEKVIANDFGFAVKVLIRDAKNIATVAKALPKDWVNDAVTKCDVMFLWEEYDSPKILEQVVIKPGIDDVKYVSGAILWRVDKSLVTRSGLMRVASSELYKHMTIRNCNTLRKLNNLMNEPAA